MMAVALVMAVTVQEDWQLRADACVSGARLVPVAAEMWSSRSSYVSDGPVVLHCHVCLIKLHLFQLSICGSAAGLCWGGDYNYNGSGGGLGQIVNRRNESTPGVCLHASGYASELAWTRQTCSIRRAAHSSASHDEQQAQLSTMCLCASATVPRGAHN